MFRFPAEDEEFLYSKSSFPLPHIVTKLVCRRTSAFLNRAFFFNPSTTLFSAEWNITCNFSVTTLFSPRTTCFILFVTCETTLSVTQTIFPPAVQQPWWARASLSSTFHNHTQLDTTHLVGLLWTSDKTDAGTSTGQQHTQNSQMRDSGIQTPNPTKRAEPDWRLRSRSHWDRDPDFVIPK